MAKGEQAISNTGATKRRRLPPEARKQQLLEVAISVFAERGLAGAHHAEIAERAGVAVSTVFVYFPTRPALVDGVLSAVESILWEIAEKAYGGPQPSIAKAIRVHFERAIEASKANPDFVAVWLDWSTSIRSEIWPRFLAGQERLAELMTAAIEQGQHEGSLRRDLDANHVAWQLIGSARTLAQMMLVRAGEDDLRGFVDTMVRSIESPGTQDS